MFLNEEPEQLNRKPEYAENHRRFKEDWQEYSEKNFLKNYNSFFSKGNYEKDENKKKSSFKSVQTFNNIFTSIFIHDSTKFRSTKILLFHTMLLNIAIHYFSSVSLYYFLSFDLLLLSTYLISLIS